jgi:hypothetical protein
MPPRQPAPKGARPPSLPAKGPYSLAAIAPLFKSGGRLLSFPKVSLAPGPGERLELTEKADRIKTYANPRGYLASFSADLRSIVPDAPGGALRGRSVGSIMQWYRAFLTGLLRYRAPDSLSPPDGADWAQMASELDAILALEGVADSCLAAFVGTEISRTVNYQGLEFLGDIYWKCVIADHLSASLGIVNEQTLTLMRHLHERRQALANLAEILGLENLVVAPIQLKRKRQGTLEDVFEAVLGAVRRIQKEIWARPHLLVNRYLVAGSGEFAHRLIHLLFTQSSPLATMDTTSQRFLKDLDRTFTRSGGVGSRGTKEPINGQMNMTLTTPPPVIAEMARRMNVDPGAGRKDPPPLDVILNSTYVVKTEDKQEGWSLICERVMSDLGRAGVTPEKLRAVRNRNLVRREFEGVYARLEARASSLGYVLDIRQNEGAYEIYALARGVDRNAVLKISTAAPIARAVGDEAGATREALALAEAELGSLPPATEDLAEADGELGLELERLVRETAHPPKVRTIHEEEGEDGVPRIAPIEAPEKAPSPWAAGAAVSRVKASGEAVRGGTGGKYGHRPVAEVYNAWRMSRGEMASEGFNAIARDVHQVRAVLAKAAKYKAALGPKAPYLLPIYTGLAEGPGGELWAYFFDLAAYDDKKLTGLRVGSREGPLHKHVEDAFAKEDLGFEGVPAVMRAADVLGLIAQDPQAPELVRNEASLMLTLYSSE